MHRKIPMGKSRKKPYWEFAWESKDPSGQARKPEPGWSRLALGPLEKKALQRKCTRSKKRNRGMVEALGQSRLFFNGFPLFFIGFPLFFIGFPVFFNSFPVVSNDCLCFIFEGLICVLITSNSKFLFLLLKTYFCNFQSVHHTNQLIFQFFLALKTTITSLLLNTIYHFYFKSII